MVNGELNGSDCLRKGKSELESKRERERERWNEGGRTVVKEEKAKEKKTSGVSELVHTKFVFRISKCIKLAYVCLHGLISDDDDFWFI